VYGAVPYAEEEPAEGSDEAEDEAGGADAEETEEEANAAEPEVLFLREVTAPANVNTLTVVDGADETKATVKMLVRKGGASSSARSAKQAAPHTTRKPPSAIAAEAAKMPRAPKPKGKGKGRRFKTEERN
jgi:hypothetical protein